MGKKKSHKHSLRYFQRNRGDDLRQFLPNKVCRRKNILELFRYTHTHTHTHIHASTQNLRLAKLILRSLKEALLHLHLGLQKCSEF